MSRRVWLIVALLITAPAGGHAAGGNALPVPQAPAAAPKAETPEARYNAGLALASKRDWTGAEASYRDAIRLRHDFPEAWNELGHALKNQKRWDESVKAYEEALRQRPQYPQALEYLGEAYVQMGKVTEAKALLERLKPLDARQAAMLEQVINGQGQGASNW